VLLNEKLSELNDGSAKRKYFRYSSWKLHCVGAVAKDADGSPHGSDGSNALIVDVVNP
jgi:hypothetical protein